MNGKGIVRFVREQYKPIQRTPVRAHEVEFMKNRLEGELAHSEEATQAIAALERLRARMDGTEKRERMMRRG